MSINLAVYMPTDQSQGDAGDLVSETEFLGNTSAKGTDVFPPRNHGCLRGELQPGCLHSGSPPVNDELPRSVQLGIQRENLDATIRRTIAHGGVLYARSILAEASGQEPRRRNALFAQVTNHRQRPFGTELIIVRPTTLLDRLVIGMADDQHVLIRVFTLDRAADGIQCLTGFIA